MLNNISGNTEAIWRVADAMRGAVEFPAGMSTYFCAFLAYTIKFSDGSYSSLSEVIEAAAGDDQLIRDSLDDVAPKVDVDRLYAMAEKVSTEDLLGYLLAGPVADSPMSGECSTPDSIASLVCGILDVQDGDLVVDFGSGVGTFLERTAKTSGGSRLIGVELNVGNVAAARIRAKVSGSGATYELDDMFDYFERALTNEKADKVFSNYPWGMRAKHLEGRSEYLEKVLKGMSEYGRPTSADWVFNRLLIDSINKDGIAVGIMTNGSAFNGADARVRRYFIENGWIRAAVSLPAGVFSPWSNIGTTLVVLGHGNTEGVRLVDATDLGTKERRGVNLSAGDVQEILARMGTDSDKSALAQVGELAEREYTLSANRYLQKEIRLVNPVALKSVILDVTRGAGLRAKELDELTCAEDTGIRYLNLANIVDGSIDDELPFLKDLDAKLEKYCLETGDLLLSKNGAPYKVAVAEVPEGQRILANGNLYTIKLDTAKVDPYYVAAFLSSPKGKESLARASKGTVIPNLPLSELRAIKIPLESAEKQAQIAAAYRAKLDEIGILKLRLARARQGLVDLFDEEA
ncbi:N-6 DNA methylase [Enorma shizhengliae]|uniref:site-specific DNA-methyltransferase (adenine-specific) n=1 Tax=Enorma shizhengliae TaxID=2606615 RepID=A0A7K0GC61_9ACTN|nr:N-6 DNA methylase [Enorma shizhengliae]MRX80796.1 N-6 DNA methylase [Enorma shizhengliae]